MTYLASCIIVAVFMSLVAFVVLDAAAALLKAFGAVLATGVAFFAAAALYLINPDLFEVLSVFLLGAAALLFGPPIAIGLFVRHRRRLNNPPPPLGQK